MIVRYLFSRYVSLINLVNRCLTTLLPTFLLTEIPILLQSKLLALRYITKYLLANDSLWLYTLPNSLLFLSETMFSVNFEAPQVKTITKVVSIAKGGSLFLLDDDKIQLDLVKGDTLEVTANTDGFNRVVLYYYDGTERKTIVELNIGRVYKYDIPCDVTYIGFYAHSATKDCNVELVIRVKKSNALEVPSWYTDDYLTSKENRIKSLIKAANGNVVSFVFLTDEHIDYLAGNFKSPALIKRLCDNVNIDAVINGGDISNGIELCITAFTQLMREATMNSMYLNVV